jgi:hypothetical protein
MSRGHHCPASDPKGYSGEKTQVGVVLASLLDLELRLFND